MKRRGVFPMRRSGLLYFYMSRKPLYCVYFAVYVATIVQAPRLPLEAHRGVDNADTK